MLSSCPMWDAFIEWKARQEDAQPAPRLTDDPDPTPAAKRVGGENQAKQDREDAQPAAMRPEDGNAGR